MLNESDMILIAQEMAAAARKYAESADRLTAMAEHPGQFTNAINGQHEMARACADIARRAGANTTEATSEACSTCERVKANGGFGPSHDASPKCESGKRPHCTCSICF